MSFLTTFLMKEINEGNHKSDSQGNHKRDLKLECLYYNFHLIYPLFPLFVPTG